MKTIIIGIICVLGLLSAQAQETRSSDTVQPVQRKSTTADYAYLVKTADGEGAVVKRLIIDKSNQTKSKKMWDVTHELGSPTHQRKIVLEVHVKPSVELLDRDELLERYHIPKEQQSLPLMIYRSFETVSPPGESLLVDLSVVDSVRLKDNGAHIAVYTTYYPYHRDMTPTLSDLQVTLDSMEFEKVGSRPAWIEEENQKRPAPWFTMAIGRVQVGNYLPERDRSLNSETNQIYRMKDTGELVIVTSENSRRLKERGWDENVARRMSGLAWLGFGKENLAVAHLEEKT